MRRLRAWLRMVYGRLRALPRPLALLIVGGGLVLLAGAGLIGFTTYDYVMNNPAFCRSCHTMEQAWTRWATSEHRKVVCHECHRASVLESTRQVVVFVLRQPQRVGPHALVRAEVCARCHESGDPRWRQVGRTAGHVVHAEQRNIQCVACHAPSIHRFRPPTAVCGQCHVAQTRGERVVKIKAMADQHCTDCHGFLRPDSPLRPTRQTCLQCHQTLPNQAGLWPPDAPMQFACGQCHKPHQQAQPVVVCTACHEKPRADMHPASILQSTPCTACHIRHRWTVGR